MSTNERKDQDATGEALSRDSLQRLAKLRVDVALLARVVRARQADASPEGVTEQRLAEMTDSLAWLEARIGQVLDEHAGSGEGIEAAALDEDEADALDDDAASQEAGEPMSDADAKPYVAGITLEQIDEINLLLESILAQGDVVTAADHAEFATATLSVIGYNIYRETSAVRDLLGDILDDQRLEPPHHPPSGVREEHASYLALPSPSVCGGASYAPRPQPAYH